MAKPREAIMLSKTWAQHLAAAVALLVALCLLILPNVTENARAMNTETFVPGQIIVKTAPGVDIGGINSSYGTLVQERFLDEKNTTIYLLKIVDGSGGQDGRDNRHRRSDEPPCAEGAVRGRTALRLRGRRQRPFGASPRQYPGAARPGGSRPRHARGRNHKPRGPAGEPDATQGAGQRRLR